MRKAIFLTELEKQMIGIPQLEKERLLNYYNETIEDAMEDGISEEEAVTSLGAMEDILKQIHAEHQTLVQPNEVSKSHTPYARYVLLFFFSPFWLTGIAMIITLYLMYITLVLLLGCALLIPFVFFLAGCFNITGIMLSNFASGIVLFGTMLVSIGITPLLYWLFMQSIQLAKLLYCKGIDAGKKTWRKVVA